MAGPLPLPLRSRRTIGTLLHLLVVAAFFPTALAQVDFDLGGRASAEFGAAVDGTLPVAAAELELRLDGEVGSGYFPDASFSATLAAGYDAATATATVRLQDAYATLYLGDADLTIGQQRVSWGSADGVNPVDVLNARDLRHPLAPEKIPAPMLRFAYQVDETLHLEAVAVPVFTPSIPPGPAWRTAPTPTLPPGVTIVEQRPPDDQRPEAALENVQFGVRATARFDRFDASLAYVRGFRTLPTVEHTLVPTGTPGQFALQPVLRYDRIQLVGADFSGVLGAVVVRGEAAYTFTDDPTGADVTVGNPSFQAVLGAEYAIPSGPRTVVQVVYDYRKADGGADAEQRAKVMTALSYQAGARTQLDLAWMQGFDGSGAVVPHLAYTVAEGITADVSAYVLYGADGTEFGGWRDAGHLRLALTYAF